MRKIILGPGQNIFFLSGSSLESTEYDRTIEPLILARRKPLIMS